MGIILNKIKWAGSDDLPSFSKKTKFLISIIYKIEFLNRTCQ